MNSRPLQCKLINFRILHKKGFIRQFDTFSFNFIQFVAFFKDLPLFERELRQKSIPNDVALSSVPGYTSPC